MGSHGQGEGLRAARRVLGIGACLLAGLLSSCAGPLTGGSGTTVPVVLWFDNFNEVLEGTATQYGRFMPAGIDVTARVGHRRCVGTADTRIVPPAAVPPDACDGVAGEAILHCSDGREIALGWTAEGQCDMGYGQGHDGDGNIVRLAFGGSQRRADAIASDAIAGGQTLPPLPAAMPDTETGDGVSTGTAFFVTWQGHLVTNHHVVRGAARIQVQLRDGEFVDASVLKLDEANDLALLRVDAIRRPLPVETPAAIERGQSVFTLGYPLVALQGQEQKATFGHVNSLTGMQGDARFTQIDVPIQPGNSGGPLIDTEGDVVGVVTSMLHPRVTYEIAGVVPQNVNYAVKSEYVHDIMQSALPDGWASERWEARDRSYQELVAEAEDSVVLVLAW